jgi:YD repeat-containing protein
MHLGTPPTSLMMPENRLTESVDAEGRITSYTYDDSDAPRQPSVIEVFDTDGTTLLRKQAFTYDDKDAR